MSLVTISNAGSNTCLDYSDHPSFQFPTSLTRDNFKGQGHVLGSNTTYPALGRGDGSMMISSPYTGITANSSVLNGHQAQPAPSASSGTAFTYYPGQPPMAARRSGDNSDRHGPSFACICTCGIGTNNPIGTYGSRHSEFQGWMAKSKAAHEAMMDNSKADHEARMIKLKIEGERSSAQHEAYMSRMNEQSARDDRIHQAKMSAIDQYYLKDDDMYSAVMDKIKADESAITADIDSRYAAKRDAINWNVNSMISQLPPGTECGFDGWQGDMSVASSALGGSSGMSDSMSMSPTCLTACGLGVSVRPLSQIATMV